MSDYAEYASKVKELNWYHCMDFGEGLYTHDQHMANLMVGKANIVFKYGIEGKSFLDIGAWDGFFSFEAERRGASRVLATDHFCWSGPGVGTRDGFDLAHKIYKSKVQAVDIDIQEMTPARLGRWDVVYMGGVLYHVHDLLKHLRILYDLTVEYAVVETALDLSQVDRPALSFVRGNSMPRPDVPLSNDPTNFFGPNKLAVIAMLEHTGFTRIETFISGEDTPLPRGFFYAWK